MPGDPPNPPQIPVQITWDATAQKGVAPDIQVPASNGPTQIKWTASSDIASFTITGLDSSEFSPAQSSGQNPFISTDRNDNSNTYNYTINATHNDGRTSSHDPKIENGT